MLYVPGNHEYDNADFDDVHERLRDTCEALDILWLERETRVIEGVRFVGTTLWADFDALVEPADSHGRGAQEARQGHACRQLLPARRPPRMRAGELFLAEALREHSLTCQAWLRNALAQPFDGPTVAITHFAPTLASADPRYGLTPGHGRLLQFARRTAAAAPTSGCTAICTARSTM